MRSEVRSARIGPDRLTRANGWCAMTERHERGCPMAATKNTNTEFELRGFNHLALVARDMAETVAWYEDILGMKLVKPPELPAAYGQHFFLDMGNGVDGIAFFYFPNAPEGVRGESLQNRYGVTAIGTMNHLAFDVD